MTKTSVNKIENAQDTYYQASTGKYMHRCDQCWKIRIDGSGCAYNNGFEYVEKGPYQHARWCPHKGKF